MIRNMANVMERERERRNMDKEEFATMCGCTDPTYIGLLEGTANPSLSTVAKISHALGLTVGELLFDVRPKTE